MSKSLLSFLWGMTLAALLALWWRSQDMADENQMLESALAGLASGMVADDKLLGEWGD